MEKAKKAVSNFLSNGGKHKTIIDEDVRKAVTEEHIYPQQHEEITTAVDREVHQHHHQTAIQPIKAQETAPTQHTARTLAVEERSFDHSNDKELQAALAKDQAKYADSSVTHETNYTTAKAPVMTSEHIHHHVHQHVQPIIQKDVYQPTTVHTTVPIHEVHTVAPIHHETTMLPAKTLEEYSASAGGFEPRSVQKLNEFDGCPTAKDKKLRNDENTKEAIHGLSNDVRT